MRHPDPKRDLAELESRVDRAERRERAIRNVLHSAVDLAGSIAKAEAHYWRVVGSAVWKLIASVAIAEQDHES